MRTFHKIDEFRTEAANALFTKQQAISVTMRLLELELADPQNNEEEKQVLTNAVSRVGMRYLDATNTQTDEILDSFGVARIRCEDIIEGINMILFEAKGL